MPHRDRWPESRAKTGEHREGEREAKREPERRETREGRTVKDEKKRGEQTGEEEEGVITVPLNCKKHL